MQAYRGVELEFVHEMRNGKVQKIVKAYKDGGRGSVVGKRFEYGTNVKGITKTQEVTDSEDDTVLYVDDVGVKVYYDVDFALKSVEVPEIEIGDTHYVIDKDFYPPMTIKARIGKIEISFTDPTKNKIYLANNKNIRGSSDEEDIRDILDDYFNDKYGDEYGDGADHTHDRLVCNESNVEFIYEYDFQDSLYPELGLLDRSYSRIHMGDNSFLIQTMNRDDDVHWLQIEVFRLDPLATGCSNRGIMFTSLDDLIPNASGRLDIGSEDYRWRNLYVDNINGSPAGGIGSGEVDSITFSNGTSIVQASDGGISVEREDGDGTKLNVYGELYVTEKIKCELGMEANTLNIKTIQFSDGTSLTSANGLGNDGESPGSGIPEGVITYTQDPIPGNGYRLDFNADRTYVNDLLIANDGMSVIGDLNVTEKISGLEMEATILYIEGIQFSDGTTLTSANGSVSIVSASIDDSNHLIFTLSDGSTIDAGELSCDGNPGGGELPSDVFEVKDGELHIKLPINFEESANFIKCGLTGGSDLTGVMILGAEILEGCRIIKASEGKLRIEGDLVVTGNITSNNSVSAATISDDNLEYYQEELRIRDEKIASLEARLAKIEEMLGINNN